MQHFIDHTSISLIYFICDQCHTIYRMSFSLQTFIPFDNNKCVWCSKFDFNCIRRNGERHIPIEMTQKVSLNATSIDTIQSNANQVTRIEIFLHTHFMRRKNLITHILCLDDRFTYTQTLFSRWLDQKNSMRHTNEAMNMQSRSIDNINDQNLNRPFLEFISKE